MKYTKLYKTAELEYILYINLVSYNAFMEKQNEDRHLLTTVSLCRLMRH